MPKPRSSSGLSVTQWMLLFLIVLAAASVTSAAPQVVTFKDYRREMGFKLTAATLEKTGIALYAISFNPSFGPRSGASLELTRGGILQGHLDLVTAGSDKDHGVILGFGDPHRPRLVAFRLSPDLADGAVLLLMRDEEKFDDPAYKIMLSTWPVKTVPNKGPLTPTPGNGPHVRIYRR